MRNKNRLQIDYIVTSSSYGENDFIERFLQKIYNQAIFCRNNFIPLTLKYENDFFVDKRWERVIELINAFIRNMTMKKTSTKIINRAINFESMYSFVCNINEVTKYKTHTFNLEEVRDLFQLVREKNYPVFKDFYEKSKVKLEGGQFINDSTRYTYGDK